MAKADAATMPAGGATPPGAAPAEASAQTGRFGTGKKKFIILGVVALLVLSVAGGAGWWFMQSGKKDTAKEKAAAPTPKAVKVDPKAPPIFVPMENFTVNLSDREYDRFLQVVLQLQVRDDKVGSLLKVYDPALRHRFLFLMSTASSEVLKTPEGKHALAQQLTSVANQVLAGAPGTEEGAPILGVSFTTFVIQ